MKAGFLFRTFAIALCFLTGGAFGQSLSASATLTQGTVQEGKLVGAHLIFDQGPSYETWVSLNFSKEGPDPGNFLMSGMVKAGQTELDVQITLPVDIPAGTYMSMGGILGQAPNHTKQPMYALESPLFLLLLPAAEDETVSPSKALGALSLTQTQFLETKSTELEQLLGAFTTKLSSNSNDTLAARELVAKTIEEADRLLLKTKTEYPSQMKILSDDIPIFFDDFHKLYTDALTDLRAPVADGGTSNPAFIYVQLKKRPRDQNPKSLNKGLASLPTNYLERPTSLSGTIRHIELCQRLRSPSFCSILKAFPNKQKFLIKG